MHNSLSNLVNNLAEGILKIKCKYGNNHENCEKFRIKYKDFDCCPEYTIDVSRFILLLRRVCLPI